MIELYEQKNLDCRSVASEASEGTTLYNRTVIRFSDGRFWVNFQLPRILRKHTSRTLFDSKLVSFYRKLNLKIIYEVKFFDTTNGLVARTEKRITAKPLRILTLKWHLVDKIKGAVWFALRSSIWRVGLQWRFEIW